MSSTVCMRDEGDSSAKIIRIITAKKGVEDKQVKCGKSEQSAKI